MGLHWEFSACRPSFAHSLFLLPDVSVVPAHSAIKTASPTIWNRKSGVLCQSAVVARPLFLLPPISVVPAALKPAASSRRSHREARRADGTNDDPLARPFAPFCKSRGVRGGLAHPLPPEHRSPTGIVSSAEDSTARTPSKQRRAASSFVLTASSTTFLVPRSKTADDPDALGLPDAPTRI